MVTFHKQLIEVKNLPALRMQLQAEIKAANPMIEKIKCIFGYKDNSTVYAYTALDFLDNYQTIIDQGPLEKFYIYQLIDKTSSS